MPQNGSTLAHYLAMHDDLYCHNIYNFFSQNTLLKLSNGNEKNQNEDYEQLIGKTIENASKSGQSEIKNAE